ncbi:hypothetical protein EJA72_01610 [Pseudomonas sp. PB120]|uniref:RHS repeat-associated core domain-containing protein n=1 Tax=Pseudomonas sp. PB120 TaxID=2494700 RepID=UPI0012FE496B|nr:RHS repeat-associated core domain-containing protein [Pseudomonas sp. PB120]MVV46953.1 hypothetical protein [Pseudomonas sp. PB120]
MLHKQIPLVRNHYDALDRLTHHCLQGGVDRQRFYCESRLVTETEGGEQVSIVQHGDQLLAQQRRNSDVLDNTLLAMDQQRSVLNTLQANRQRPIAYSPYGYHPCESGVTSLLGFNGQRPDTWTGHYLLGNGYRAFNPGLMRFNSPDRLSPFGKGGLNAYVYCLGDPVNRSDPLGSFSSSRSDWFSRIATGFKSLQMGVSVKRVKNVTRLTERVMTFEDTYEGAPRLNFQGHKRSKDNFLRLDRDLNVDAKGLLELARDKGLEVSKYKNLRLVMCHSSSEAGPLSGGATSFAEELSLITGLRVKGFKGKISARDFSKKFPNLRDGEVAAGDHYFFMEKNPSSKQAQSGVGYRPFTHGLKPDTGKDIRH